MGAPEGGRGRVTEPLVLRTPVGDYNTLPEAQNGT